MSKNLHIKDLAEILAAAGITDEAPHIVQPSRVGLDVGEGGIIKPFGGAKRSAPGIDVGAQMPGTGAPTSGGGGGILDYISRLGVDLCRFWGEDPPQGAFDPSRKCFNGKKVCLIPFPYLHTVGIGATEESFILKAKKWYWPILWADTSESEIDVAEVKYQGDPVTENGTGSGAFTPSTVFAPTAFYGIAAGFPAFGNTDGNGLEFLLNNSDGAATHDFKGVFWGISVRS